MDLLATKGQTHAGVKKINNPFDYVFDRIQGCHNNATRADYFEECDADELEDMHRTLMEVGKENLRDELVYILEHRDEIEGFTNDPEAKLVMVFNDDPAESTIKEVPDNVRNIYMYVRDYINHEDRKSDIKYFLQTEFENILYHFDD